MKLQSASKLEIKRMAVGTLVGSAILVAVMAVLSLMGIGTFDYKVFIGALGGCAVAILNFTVMCMTIQRAVDISETKQMRAFIQGSYNGRLLFQAAWIVAAYLIPHVNVVAAAVPLLFPNLIIMYLQARGKLVTPSKRRDSSTQAQPEDEPEDRLESFEA